VHFDWKKQVDHIEEAGMQESYENSLHLSRSGILVGPSSGFAYAGLIRFLRKREKKGGFDRLRNKDGKIVAVFICCDGPFQYLQEYFTYVDKDHFPRVKKSHLLINK
jgi:cysteine synthase